MGLPIFLAIAGGLQAYGQYQTGKAQESALKRQAEEERLRAQTEELARREELNRTIAANQLAMVTSGISGASPESVSLESARKVSGSEAAIGLSERLKQAQLVRQGEAAKFAGTVGAGSTLFNTGADILKL